jgi:predicted transcriptional regulator
VCLHRYVLRPGAVHQSIIARHRGTAAPRLPLTGDERVVDNDPVNMTINDDKVFRAIADPTRRFLLDLLSEREGRTLTEIEKEADMGRIGVMKHLRILEDAGLIVAE